MDNKLVRIGNVDILLKEYKGQRIVTFNDIDAVHERVDGTARRNFNSNKKRFIKDEDYFIVSSDEIRTSHLFPISDNDYMDKTVITESGYLMLVKSLSDDLAWSVQRDLVNNYFRSKESNISISDLSPELQMFNKIFTAVAQEQIERKKLSEKVDRIENTQKVITDTFSRETTKDFRPWVKQCITAIVESPNYHYLGTRAEKYQAVTAESYDRLNRKKPCRLDQRVQTEKGRAINAGASAARINAINKLTIIESDKALKPIYETVLKEMMIAYCVEASVKRGERV